MTSLGQELTAVREALLRAAEDEAAAQRQAAQQAGASALELAKEKAHRLVAQARQQGSADAAAAVAVQQAAGRRQARAVLLAARRDAYEKLVTAVHEGAAGLKADPDYPRWRSALRQLAFARLGPQAQVREEPSGGVAATTGHRRLDLRLERFADNALAELAEQAAGPVSGDGWEAS